VSYTGRDEYRNSFVHLTVKCKLLFFLYENANIYDNIEHKCFDLALQLQRVH